MAVLQARRSANGLAIACASVVLLAGYGCDVTLGCHRPRGCLGWVEIDETYTVELVQHLDFGSEEEVPAAYPLPPRTCGTTLDFAEGDTLEMTPNAVVDWSSDDQCGMGCFYAAARISAEGVEIVAERRNEPGLGTRYFIAQATVRIGDACSGWHSVAISALDSYFREHSDTHVATDHVLVRRFGTEDATCPAGGGSQLYGRGEYRGQCWDTWAVRIRDSSGKLVTRDLPPPESMPAQGGADAGQSGNGGASASP